MGAERNGAWQYMTRNFQLFQTVTYMNVGLASSPVSFCNIALRNVFVCSKSCAVCSLIED